MRLYYADKEKEIARPKETAMRIAELIRFFGNATMDTLDGYPFDQYFKHRVGMQWRRFKSDDGKIGKTGRPMRFVTNAAARRELEDLRAALNHCRPFLSRPIAFKMPPKTKSDPRQTWLTPAQAAAIVRAAYRHREAQFGESTERHTLRHVARFVVIALRTGTRSGAICAASFIEAIGRGHVDLENCAFHRLPKGARITKKRQPSAPLSDKMADLLGRWHRLDVERYGAACHAVIQWNGEPVKSVRKAFASAVELAAKARPDLFRNIDPAKITPHVLRHTAVTWMLNKGISIWQIAGYLGMTPEVIQNTYGHHDLEA
ncbi:MAG TPA: tyrosine-type recombinase/integrase, partial [Pirellulales bacterium]|nr:tyrosine-type recombinase/integrase [Pirellulales bacterium]